MPTPDPSASLTPYQTWVVAASSYAVDQVGWLMVLAFIAASLVVMFLAVIAVNVVFRS